jgi:outer membrane lipoprotein SlyB
MRRLLGLSAALVMLTGCATTSQTTWTPTVDTYGSSRAQYLTRDTEECRSLAMRASGSTSEQATQTAVSRGLVGAAAGAAVGAVVDRDNWRGARRGAAIGGVGGALSGGYGAAAQTDAAFQRAFNNCMRQRGHTVIN